MRQVKRLRSSRTGVTLRQVPLQPTLSSQHKLPKGEGRRATDRSQREGPQSRRLEGTGLDLRGHQLLRSKKQPRHQPENWRSLQVEETAHGSVCISTGTSGRCSCCNFGTCIVTLMISSGLVRLRFSLPEGRRGAKPLAVAAAAIEKTLRRLCSRLVADFEWPNSLQRCGGRPLWFLNGHFQ